MMLRLGRVLPWALLILFGVRGLLAMRVDGATADEPRHLAYGARALESGTFLRDESFNSKMPVSVLNALPVALASRGQALSGSRQLFLARLPSLLLGLLLGGLIWSWARELFGVWSGALALFLYTFCPNFLAHSHLVTTDISTALGMFAATYAFWRHLERPGRGRLLVAAAAFGLAQLAKVTAFFLAPIFALILGIRLCRDAAREWRDHRPGPAGLARFLGRGAARDGGLLLVLGCGALVALNVGFWGEGTFTPLKGYTLVSPSFRSLAAVPVLRDVPLPLPYAYVQGFDMVSRDSLVPRWSYLRGRYSQTGFRSYFLWCYLIKVPVATQLLLLLAFWLWGTGRVRAPGSEKFLAVPMIFLLVYLSLFFRVDVGFRYALPILPFLFVFTGRVAAARWNPALTGVPLLWLAISSWSIHPHYLAYFNELAGGPANGWRWLIDSNLDWDQDAEYVRTVYAPRSPVPVLFDPGGPVAGRIAVNLSNLVGLNPDSARRHAWLRDNFTPIATLRYTWKVFDVTEADLARCCAGLARAPVVGDLEGDLARAGQPFTGGDGVGVRFQERLNDGTLGANEPTDAARTVPPRPQPVRAWFGIDWPAPRTVGRVVAFPSFGSQGPAARKFLALDYVFQSWDGNGWLDIPGTRVTGNQATKVEHRFTPLRTQRIRLLIERERNESGTEGAGGFRAACLEIAAYER
jgi:4-amino-4-deoxy-L-arabinose transferase-like glycosyltransferase